MASGSGLATALAAIKAHGVAVTILGALVVGGGGAAAAVATGAVHVPGISGQQTGSGNQTTQRVQACADNGDVARLAAIYAPMFGGSTADAQTEMCTLFSGSGGHAYGLGQVQQILEITAAIERSGGATGCLTTSAVHGQPTETGKPSDPGKPTNPGNSGSAGSAGTPAAGQPNTAIPSAATTDTNTIIGNVIASDAHGTPLAQLARNCGATPTTGNPDGGVDTGGPTTTPGAKPSETPDARPTGTPGARPTGTPGGGHP
jgi:pilus assembly protein FimV